MFEVFVVVRRYGKALWTPFALYSDLSIAERGSFKGITREISSLADER